jgi:hypothetical protein
VDGVERMEGMLLFPNPFLLYNKMVFLIILYSFLLKVFIFLFKISEFSLITRKHDLNACFQGVKMAQRERAYAIATK